MSLVDSNTFIEPTAGTSLNAARGQINNAIRSLLTNFRSSSSPSTTVNLLHLEQILVNRMVCFTVMLTIMLTLLHI